MRKPKKKSGNNLLTQAEYAHRRGISRVMVQKLVSQGIIKLIDKKIDPEDADRSIEENSDPARASFRKGGDGSKQAMSFSESRAAKEHLRALLMKLEYEQKLRSLVSAKEVEKEAFETAQRFRSAMENIPSRLPLPKEERALVLKEIHKALEGLSV